MMESWQFKHANLKAQLNTLTPLDSLVRSNTNNSFFSTGIRWNHFFS